MTDLLDSLPSSHRFNRGPLKIGRLQVGLIAVGLLLGSEMYGATREVGSGQTYPSISAALAAANVGDIVNVHAGTYSETCTVADNNLTLRANAGDSPVINGRVDVGSFTGVTVTGLSITGWSSSTVGNYGVHADGGSGLTVSNCTIYNGWGTGIYVRNSTNATLTGNTIHANKNTPGADGTGIIIISGHASAASYATGVNVLNNTIYDHDTDGMQIHGQYITVSGNNVYNNLTTNWAATHPDGIQCIAGKADGYTDVQHIRIYDNIFRNHTQNIFVEGSSSGDASLVTDVQIWNNVVYCDSGTVNGVAMDSIATKGMMIKYVKDCVVVNNNFGRHGNTAIYFQSCGTAGMVFKNNIVSNSLNYGMYNDTIASASAGSFDSNIYHCAGSAIIWGSSFFTSRSAFAVAVSGQESKSKDADPLITNWTNSIVSSGSPCIDAGVNVGALFSTDYVGTARPQGGGWDIGAYEFIAAGVVAPSNAVASISIH